MPTLGSMLLIRLWGFLPVSMSFPSARHYPPILIPSTRSTLPGCSRPSFNAPPAWGYMTGPPSTWTFTLFPTTAIIRCSRSTGPGQGKGHEGSTHPLCSRCSDQAHALHCGGHPKSGSRRPGACLPFLLEARATRRETDSDFRLKVHHLRQPLEAQSTRGEVHHASPPGTQAN